MTLETILLEIQNFIIYAWEYCCTFGYIAIMPMRLVIDALEGDAIFTVPTLYSRGSVDIGGLGFFGQIFGWLSRQVGRLFGDSFILDFPCIICLILIIIFINIARKLLVSFATLILDIV